MIKDDIPTRLEWATTLYTNFTHEIRFFKDQQWRVLYFVIILQAGLFIFLRAKCPALSFIIILTILYLFVTWIGFKAYNNLQKSIDRNRRHLNNLKNHYITLSNMIGETAQDREEDLAADKDRISEPIFRTAIIAGLIIFLSLFWMNFFYGIG